MKTVDVLIPVYRPGKKFSRLLNMLEEQTIHIRRIIVINTEKSLWNGEGYKEVPGLEVHHVTRQEFDHGRTRDMGMWYSDADIVVCMTDDAVPADAYMVENLLKGFSLHGPSGEQPAVVYGRQLPDKNCRYIERYTRTFNYPDRSMVKTEKDVKDMGIKAYFASNVCCAYDREVYYKLGGFIKKAIFNEDMIFAAGALKAGYAVVYAADARVIHSHNYSGKEQFKRNFDLAVSQTQNPEIFDAVPSEGEGIRLVKKTAAYLVKTGHIWLIPQLFYMSGCKYAGYRMGKIYQKLPKKLIMKCTMNKEYWR